MKIAVISDIHGNLEALKATLADIESRNIDKIICLGDIIAKGTHSLECIKLVKEKCDVVLQGNCDRFFTGTHDLETLSGLDRKRVLWNDKMLTAEDKEYLSNLPFCYECYMSGSFIRMFHAFPQSDCEVYINTDSISRKYELFQPSIKTITDKVADIVIYGHIHHQYMDKLYNKTIINVGSVGNAFDLIREDKKDSSVLEICNIHYVILEGDYGSKEYKQGISIEFVRLPYDISKELEDEESNIEKEAYREELLKGTYRDMFKIKEE